MNCETAKEQLALALYDDPELEERTELQRHLNKCSACGEVWQAFRETRRSLDGFPLPPSGAVPRSSGSTVSDPRPHFSRWRMVGRAAAAVVLVGLSFFGLASLARWQIEFRDGGFSVQCAWSDSDAPQAESLTDHSWHQQWALRFAEFERRHEEDLLALTAAMDLSREQDSRRHWEQLRQLEENTSREFLLARNAWGELIHAVNNRVPWNGVVIPR